MEYVIFVTETGSTYEVDLRQKRVRRVSGSKVPTRRFANDGDWRSYVTISPIVVGESVFVQWEHDPRPDDIRLKHNTITSIVVSVQNTEASS